MDDGSLEKPLALERVRTIGCQLALRQTRVFLTHGLREEHEKQRATRRSVGKSKLKMARAERMMPQPREMGRPRLDLLFLLPVDEAI